MGYISVHIFREASLILTKSHGCISAYETILQLLVTFRTSILFPVHLHIYETSMPIDDCDLGRLVLTHWGRVTHICVDNLTIIGSDNGLSPGRRQAITWTNVGILLIGPMGTNFSEMLIEIHTFSFENVVWKMAAILSRPQCVNHIQRGPSECFIIECYHSLYTGHSWDIHHTLRE